MFVRNNRFDDLKKEYSSEVDCSEKKENSSEVGSSEVDCSEVDCNLCQTHFIHEEWALGCKFQGLNFSANRAKLSSAKQESLMRIRKLRPSTIV